MNSSPHPPLTLCVAEVADATLSEGPGTRFAVWVQGCRQRCEGCCNPEMFEEGQGQRMDLPRLIARLERAAGTVEGISLLGGEPFLQAAPLARLARAARGLHLGVVVFSGYTLEELRASDLHGAADLLAVTDLLVDGPYLRDRASARRRWIGSDNQRMHFLSDRYRDHPDILQDHAQSVHLSISPDGDVQVSGWPSLAEALGQPGVKPDAAQTGEDEDP